MVKEEEDDRCEPDDEGDMEIIETKEEEDEDD